MSAESNKNSKSNNEDNNVESKPYPTSIVRNLNTIQSIRTETLEEKDFDNPVSKRYGVKINPELLTEEKFTNLRRIDSYPLPDYSYENEEGETIHLAEVYILQDKRSGDYIYYLDEPKLSSKRAGTDNPEPEIEEIELEWYNRIKSDFDSQISKIDKDKFSSRALSELKKSDQDDLDYIINKIENDELYRYYSTNRVISVLYDNILKDVVDMIESLPAKEDAMYESIPEPTKMKIRYYLQQEYLEFGKISPMFNDPYIEEINCNGPNEPIQVFHSEYDENLITTQAYGEDELRNAVNKLANKSDEQFNTATPLTDGSLPDGSRIQLTLAEDDSGNAVKGDNFTIRVFDEVPLTPVDLLNYNTMSVDQMVWLWLAVEFGKSGIIAGGTASGKSTTLNAISTFTQPSDKIVTIEDTQELVLHASNFISNVTRESVGSDDDYDIGMMKLITAALRQRPDYLIIGEVRDEAARPMFQAMSTGHTSYTTFHADNITDLKNRLTEKPINVGTPMLKSLNFVLNQDKLEDGRRVLKELREVKSVVNGKLKNDLITAFNYKSREFEGIRWGESDIIDNIKYSNGWTDEKMAFEIERRKDLLEYMKNNLPRGNEHNVDEQMKRSKKITRVIKLYMKNPEMVTRLKETDLMLKDDLNKYIDIILALEESDKIDEEHINEYIKIIVAKEDAGKTHKKLEDKINTYQKLFDAKDNANKLAEHINNNT